MITVERIDGAIEGLEEACHREINYQKNRKVIIEEKRKLLLVGVRESHRIEFILRTIGILTEYLNESKKRVGQIKAQLAILRGVRQQVIVMDKKENNVSDSSPSPFLRKWIGLGIGITYMLTLFMGAMSVVLLLVTPSLIIFLFNRILFHRIIALVANAWFYFMCGMLELVGGVEIDLHLHASTNSNDISLFAAERALLMSNHVCHTDWYPLLCVLGRFDQLHQVRIVLKDSLKKIPFFGWGLQAFVSIFLSRQGGTDIPWIKKVLQYTNHVNQPTSLIMFPEGTVIDQNTIQKSHKFSDDNDLEKLHHVIQPRTGAFTAIMDNRNLLDSVYDVTIKYEEYAPNETPSEGSFVKWRLPPRMSMYVRRYPMEHLPHSEEELVQWLRQRFIEKEALLRSLNKQDGGKDTSQHTHLAYKPVIAHSLSYKLKKFLPSMIFMGLLIICFVVLVTTWWGFLFTIFATLLWLFMGHVFNGFDAILIDTSLKTKSE
eukprot:m.62292 g.62292  ORF g.62292 m.62292 type:complete len:488 (-) comp8025_c3_seq3:8268-9731(-)